MSANPRNVIKVMREFFRMELELGYRIPKNLRLLFIFRTYAKSFVFRFIGEASLDRIVRIKRSLLGIRQ